MNNSVIPLQVIGTVQSPYKEKFAIPRQPNLVDAAKGTITLINKANNADLVQGLAQFSHIWLLFIFHETQQQGWKPLVRPPRLGGNKKMGVLATRSTFRPNPIGMSVVKLIHIEVLQKDVIIHVSGLDLLDNTPIVDIKPYIPYSDAIPDAQAGFAQSQPEKSLSVNFTESALTVLESISAKYPDLRTLITQVLQQDPRPAYKKNSTTNQAIDEKIYGITLYDFNIRWRLSTITSIDVFDISKHQCGEK